MHGIVAAGLMMTPSVDAWAQTVETRHWQGATALSRQAEHVIASTITEWRSLWGRVGAPAPDVFEPGRTHAVGIFLGRRASEGYAVNFLSASRRRDRIVVVFEERMPADLMTAQRSSQPPAPPRPVASNPGAFGGPGAGFAPPNATASLAPPPPPAPAARPVGQPTSPWAIILIHRADLPVSVEQRLFR
ncbi:MAG: hypothetical protein FJX11_16375 [Alphaproteobacteria bacterium]|nr:hypothetical protein [Alphaproteobacteria bacterium]